MSGGCGGGSGDPVATAPSLPSEPIPDQEQSIPFTHEELSDLLTQAYEELDLDKLIFTDGTYVKNYDYSILETSTRSSSTRGAEQTDVEKSVIGAMLEKAVFFAKLFPDGERETYHEPGADGKPRVIKQDRYVYIWDGKYPDIPTEATPYCNHEMYGMDCVGLIYQSALAAGIDGMNKNPMALATPSTWNVAFERLNYPLEAFKVTVGIDPEPGDILVWRFSTWDHVAIAARDDDGKIYIISSVGDGRATCDQYEENITTTKENPAAYTRTRGPIALDYEKAKRWFHQIGSDEARPEEKRIRFRAKTQTPSNVVLDGLWRPIKGYSRREVLKVLQESPVNWLPRYTEHSLIENSSEDNVARLTFQSGQDGNYFVTQSNYLVFEYDPADFEDLFGGPPPDNVGHPAVLIDNQEIPYLELIGNTFESSYSEVVHGEEGEIHYKFEFLDSNKLLITIIERNIFQAFSSADGSTLHYDGNIYKDYLAEVFQNKYVEIELERIDE
jgi:hypothetical protein